MTPGETVLVTGATGFIGRHLCEDLLTAGYRVRGIRRRQSRPSDLQIEWFQLEDIGPATDWSLALTGISYVVHLAGLAHQIGSDSASVSSKFYSVNTDGTRTLAKAIAQYSEIKRIVFVSSIAALNSDCPSTDSQVHYGRSKLLGELALEEELSNAATEWCVIRPPLVYGAGNPGNMARLLKLVHLGLPLPLKTIRNQRSLIFVGNLSNAIIACLKHPAAGNSKFTVADEATISTPELLRMLSAASGEKLFLFPVPLAALKLLAKVGDGIKLVLGRSIGFDSYSLEKLSNTLVVDNVLISQQVGWSPPYSIEQGLRLAVDPTRGLRT